MNANNPSIHHQNDSAVIEKVRIRRPPRYAVVMLNDDFTPMEFVVEVLQSIFYLDHSTSTTLMWEIHTKGKAKCGVFSYDIAVTKVKKVTEMATAAGHPLRCIVEQERGSE